MAVNISIENANLQGNGQVVGVINEGIIPGHTGEALKELESLRLDLEKVDQLKETITSLEAAIREQNQFKAKTVLQQLTSNFASSFLANVISNIVSPLL